VSATADVLKGASRHLVRAALVTDVGSTKRGALAAATALGLGECFVGSHPMAGDHRSGWAAARRGLFADATTYICPTDRTRPESLALARELWTSLGARTEVIDADVHDKRVAFTSHLPHAVSAALALALSKAKCDVSELGPGGRDVVRIAASSPDMWAAIMVDNADAVLTALAALQAELGDFERVVVTRDARALHALFSAARAWTVTP
jgi:prephenate dehydrogenase